MKTLSTMLAAALALLAAGAALAGSEPTRQQQEARLRKAEQQLAAAAGTTHGSPQAEYLQERAKVDRLIQDLRSGRPVDPAQVDAALLDARTAP